MWWLALLLIGGILGALGARRSRVLGGRPPPKLLPPATQALLEEFAEANGWKLFAGDDKQIRGEAWKLFSLAGPPSLETLYALRELDPKYRAREPAAYARIPWVPTGLLRRDTADGPQSVLGARAPGGTNVVIACIGTTATIEWFGLDVVGWPVNVYTSGEPPEGADFETVLANLGVPLRLRFAEGTLLLRVPGKLEPPLIETLLERLDSVRVVLPRRPDLGPLR